MHVRCNINQETYLAESAPRPLTDNKVFNSGFLQRAAKISLNFPPNVHTNPINP